MSTESNYSAKAPQNMRYKEQNKLKKTLLFQIYHSLIFFEKCTHFTIFVIFLRFCLYFAFDAKIKVYKRNLWSRWFFGMKEHYIRSVYCKYPFEILSKSIFEFFFDSRHHLHDNYRHPVKKNVTSEKMPLGVWISHQIISSMSRWFDEKISKIRP